MTVPAPEPHFFDTPDGMRHAWYELGDPAAPGPVVVMQHGFSATTFHEWVAPGISANIAKALGRRVVGLDAMGHGQSTRSHDSKDYGEGRMARDVSALIDQLGVTEFDYVGYSMGGVIGLGVGANEPRVRRLIVAGIGEGVIARGGVDTRVLDRGLLAKGLRADDPSEFPELVRAFRGGIEAMGNDRLALAAHADSYQHSVTGLDRITVPTLLIAGDADPLAIHPEALSSAIDGCQLVIVPGDHVQARLVPEFTAAVIDFLR